MKWLVLALLAACEPFDGEGDVVYDEARHLTLDVRAPAGDGPFAAVVFIHGGGWVTGDLDMYQGAVDMAVARGMVGVTINYRLADRHRWPAQIEDVRCALRWLSTNAATLHVDPTRVATMGESAGGHLAFMAAYADDAFASDCAGNDIVPKAAVSLAGVDDLAAVYTTTEWYIKAYITRWLGLPDGARVEDHAAAFAEASPLGYLARGPHVPGLILQGSDDTVVPPASQRSFIEAAAEAGHDITLEVLEGVDHDGIRARAVLTRALDWLATEL